MSETGTNWDHKSQHKVWHHKMNSYTEKCTSYVLITNFEVLSALTVFFYVEWWLIVHKDKVRDFTMLSYLKQLLYYFLERSICLVSWILHYISLDRVMCIHQRVTSSVLREFLHVSLKKKLLPLEGIKIYPFDFSKLKEAIIFLVTQDFDCHLKYQDN